MEFEREMPALASAQYASTTTTGMNFDNGAAVIRRPFIGSPDMGGIDWHLQLAEMVRQQADMKFNTVSDKAPQRQLKKEKHMAEEITRRLVQIFIADPDANVPLANALLYSGEQHLTDLSDQELFFEIDISGILKKHNETRITLTDKSVKSKTVNLEPARIRDLKMTVVTIAAF